VTPYGPGLHTQGGLVKLTVDVYDYQGKDSHYLPKIECPELFYYTKAIPWISDGDGFSTYEFFITNSEDADVGDYKLLIKVRDKDDDDSPNFIDLAAYQIVTLSVVKYETDDFMWVRQAGGVSSEAGYAVAALSDDSFVITGPFDETVVFGKGEPNEVTLVIDYPFLHDIFIARYDPDGAVMWAKKADGLLVNNVHAITSLADDSVVLVGEYMDSICFDRGGPNETWLNNSYYEYGNCDTFVACYNPDGSLDWVDSIGADYSEEAHGVAALTDGTFVVTGFYQSWFGFPYPKGESDIYVHHCNSDGSNQWVACAGGTGDDIGEGVVCLPDNSVVATGEFSSSAIFGEGEPNETTLVSAGDYDFFIAQYNPDGTLVWAKRAGGVDADMASTVTSPSDGLVVATGYFNGSATFGEGEPNETTLVSDGYEDIFIACYNPDGSLAWAKRAGGWQRDRAPGITALPDGTVVVAGYFWATITLGEGEANQTTLSSPAVQGNNFDMFLAWYNPDGTLACARRDGGIEQDRAYGVTSLSDDSVIVTGYFQESAVFGEGEPTETALESAGWYDIFIARFFN
jgi:uncharacterized delta-60 repeat protein